MHMHVCIHTVVAESEDNDGNKVSGSIYTAQTNSTIMYKLYYYYTMFTIQCSLLRYIL